MSSTHLIATFLPRVEDPWPDTINLAVPFTLAGTVAVLGLVAAALTRQPEHQGDAWVRTGTVLGFLLGALFYLVSLAAQLLSR